MKIARLALTPNTYASILAAALLASASTAFAFTPPQAPDAPAQVVPLPPAGTSTTATASQAQPQAAPAAGKTRAQVEQELAQAKANGQYTFGELDYPPKAAPSN